MANMVHFLAQNKKSSPAAQWWEKCRQIRLQSDDEWDKSFQSIVKWRAWWEKKSR